MYRNVSISTYILSQFTWTCYKLYLYTDFITNWWLLTFGMFHISNRSDAVCAFECLSVDVSVYVCVECNSLKPLCGLRPIEYDTAHSVCVWCDFNEFVTDHSYNRTIITAFCIQILIATNGQFNFFIFRGISNRIYDCISLFFLYLK